MTFAYGYLAGFLSCTFYIGAIIYVAEKPNRRRLRNRPRLRLVDTSGSVQELSPLDARPFVQSERSRIALRSLTIKRRALGMSGRLLRVAAVDEKILAHAAEWETAQWTIQRFLPLPLLSIAMTYRRKKKPTPHKPGSKPWRVGVHDFIGSAVTGGIALGAQLFHALAQVATSDNIAAASNKNTTLMAAVAFLLAGVDLFRRVVTDNRKGPSN